MGKLTKANHEIMELGKKMKQLKARRQTQTTQFNAKMDEIKTSERTARQKINDLNQKINNIKLKMDEAESTLYWCSIIPNCLLHEF